MNARTAAPPLSSNQQQWVQSQLQEAIAQHQAGRMKEAGAAYKRILDRFPLQADALHLAGLVAEKEGNYARAEALIKKALAQFPNMAEMHSNLGNVYMHMGRFEESVRCHETCIKLKPAYPDGHLNLGNVYQAIKNYPQAIRHYQSALGLNPAFALAKRNLAMALAAIGKQDEALAQLHEALTLAPNDAEILRQMGLVYKARHELGKAEESFMAAQRLAPGNADILNDIALLCFQQHNFKDAERYFRYAIGANPAHADALLNLALHCDAAARWEEAQEYYAKAYQARPDGAVAFQAAAATPLIPLSKEQLAQVTARVRAYLEDMSGESPAQQLPLSLRMMPIFNYAYTGEGIRDMCENAATYYLRHYPELAWQAPHIAKYAYDGSRKLKLGIASAHFYSHTIRKFMRGLIEHLPRELFDIVIFSPMRGAKAIYEEIGTQADKFIQLPMHFDTAREMIARHRLDIVFYPDIGMEPLTYFMAFSRLAPVQCVTWGHPETTGIPNMDYFISSRYLETEGAEAHYSEKLVLLDALPTYYYRPTPPAPASRASFGLSDNDNLYLCPQSLFKIHPEFDAMLAGLLRRDPNARLVLIQGLHEEWGQRIKARFGHSFDPGDVERVTFLPRMPEEKFLQLMQLADAVIDPLHFGGGNTSYEALSFGVPIVTLPGRYMRGRVTAGCYRQMGIEGLVARSADAYVEIAYRLANDKPWRKQMSELILERSDRLFEDQSAVNQLGDFFRQAVQRRHAV